MSEPTADLIPLYESSRGFDTSMRGYDRVQVDREIARLDDDLRVTAAERDAAAARNADLAAQIASAQAQAESLRRQLRAATETVTAENVDDHVQQILHTAKLDAAKMRAEVGAEAEHERTGAADSAARTRNAAQAEAERILGDATARLTEADETFRRKIGETEARKAQVEAALAESERTTRETENRLSTDAEATRNLRDAQAQAEREQLDVTARAKLERRDAESQAKRDRVEDDFEITMRVRRTAAAQEQAKQKADAQAYAAKTVADARAEGTQLIADAVHEVRRLHTIRDDTHTHLDTLHTQLRASLDEARSATPDEPALPRSSPPTGPWAAGATDDPDRPMPGPGATEA